jgi:two-component system phosphate regulon sensor histidine kinase PhoR
VTGGVEVIVSDKGIGLSKEAKKLIFEKFYRVHTGNLHDVKGFGLGLSYVKAMMDAHKGRVEVRSELGKGSNFILFFPTSLSANA